MTRFGVGVDFGKRTDHAAIATLEAEPVLQTIEALPGTYEAYTSPMRYVTTMSVVDIRRIPLGTRYHAIVDMVEMVLDHPQVAPDHVLVCDATGVGEPIIEIMQERNLLPVPILIHGGKEVSKHDSGYSVPLRDLAIKAQSMMQSNRLRIVPGIVHDDQDMSEILIKELRAYQMKMRTNPMTGKSHDHYEAMLESTHDDCVMAMMLSAWYLGKVGPSVDEVAPDHVHLDDDYDQLNEQRSSEKDIASLPDPLGRRRLVDSRG